MLELKKKFSPEKYEAQLLVEAEENTFRLDQFVALFLESFSRQNIKKKIARGEVQIKDRPFPHKASVKVYEGEVVTIFTPRGELEDEYWNGKKLELQFDPEVIFENDDLVAISKPAYMVTHPTGQHLFNCATVYFEHKYQKTVHSIHRLDRETSGVLLLGKNPAAAQRITSLFENDVVKKCYFFMAHKKKDDYQFPIMANERLGQENDYIPRLFVHCYPEKSKNGKYAQTKLVELFQNDDYLLGLALPKTGRQHQIRAHAAFHALPLVGDKLYNGDPRIFMRFKDGVATKEDHDLMDLHRHALHATALKLNWPNQDNPTLFRAPIPQDFKKWIQKRIPEVDIPKLESEIDALIKDLF